MKIKLGKVPDTRKIKLAVSLSAELMSQIDEYAKLYFQTWQQELDATALIPHILEQFLVTDRAFRKWRKESRRIYATPLTLTVEAPPETEPK
jgi:hypothetical protein